jgi:hypothetical protein
MECVVSVRNSVFLMKYCPGILIWIRNNITETLGLPVSAPTVLAYYCLSLCVLYAVLSCIIFCTYPRL